MFFLLAILVWSAWGGHATIYFLVSLMLSAVCFTKIWERLSLKRVECMRLLSETRAFPGETINLRLQVANRKLLPLPWIQIDDEIPLNMAGNLPLLPGSRDGFGLLRCSTALLWYSKASWNCGLNCRQRGYFPLGPIMATSGDIFGFYMRSAVTLQQDTIIVYPKIYPIDRFYIPSQHPLGDTKAEQQIFQDPTRIIGLRDYTSHDSLRHVHWKASARRQELQVKVFESTTTLKASLFLSAGGFQNEKDGPDRFEFAVSTVASIAANLIEQKSMVGLHVNSPQVDSGQLISILPGGSHARLMEILEALAKIGPDEEESFEAFLIKEQRKLPWGTTLIIVLAEPLNTLPELLVSLKEAGNKLIVLLMDYKQKSKPAGDVVCYHVIHPDNSEQISFEIIQ